MTSSRRLCAAVCIAALMPGCPAEDRPVDADTLPTVVLSGSACQAGAPEVERAPTAPPSCGSVDLSACGGAGGAVIEEMTSAVALEKDAFFFLRANHEPSAVEVRVDGQLVAPAYCSDPDFWDGVEGCDSTGFGAIYPLPVSPKACPVRVSVRAAGLLEDDDCAVLGLTRPSFVDIASEVGIDFNYSITGDYMPLVHGGAFGDFDNDGDPDLYIPDWDVEGRFYENSGDQNADDLPDFVDVTSIVIPEASDMTAGTSAVFVDYDNDGDQDLFVGRNGHDVLLRNQLVEDGASTFIDVTEDVGLRKYEQRTTGTAWGDYDNDGDLDLYVTTHFGGVDWSGIWWQERLYRNDDGTFTEVTALLQKEGVKPTRIHGFAAVWLDYDLDGDVDLLVTSDDEIFHDSEWVGPNVLWRNDGPGSEPGDWKFIEVGLESGFGVVPDGKNRGLNAMGIGVGDVNRDGYPDVAISNIGPNYLLYGDGDPDSDGLATFTDAFAMQPLVGGVRRSWLPWEPETLDHPDVWYRMSITWAAELMDFDNDGNLDLFFAGGSPAGFFKPRAIPNALFRNLNDGSFEDVTLTSGLADLSEDGVSSAVADLDRDGWLDLAVGNVNGPFRIYHNRGAILNADAHWLVVDLKGTTSNRDAIGAIVRVTTADGEQQTCFRTTRPSNGGGGEKSCHFGLGTRSRVAELAIRWPGAMTWSVLEEPPAVDQRITCVEPAFE